MSKYKDLTTNYPEHQTVPHHRGDHYQGEGHSPEHVQDVPGCGGGGRAGDELGQ